MISTLQLLVESDTRVTVHDCLELNGFIYIWHHAEGINPTWIPPEIEEITSGKWKYRGRTEHYIASHVEVWIHKKIVTCRCYTLRKKS